MKIGVEVVMRGALIIIGVIAGAVSASSMATAESKTRKAMFAKPALFMRVYGPAQPPYGFVRFCDSRPQACAASPLEDMRFQPTAEHLSELDEVNRSVNRAIAPATDIEIYGVSEFWTLPSNQGDCEDYALLKQKVLLQRGWPSSALLLTVVRDEKGDGHAVLTARTAQGDYVLDNKIDEVRLWNRTGYEYMMRQSYIDPRVWVSLDETSGDVPHSLAAAGNNR
ncbi:MAG: transglutaminase-like cysteine peptidase [Hyphomicrobium sp.]